MITVTTDDSKPIGRDIVALLRHHRSIVRFEDTKTSLSKEPESPEGYVSEEYFWKEFDQKLLKSYGKL